MKILFLDQSGNLGGAELCLMDIAKPYREDCLVGLFAEGEFKKLLEDEQIPVKVLNQQPIEIRKESGVVQGIGQIGQLLPLIQQVTQTAKAYDLIYANTQKALVIGAISSLLSRRPLVYHLHDILSVDHFSRTNRWIAVTLANRCASWIIANSESSRTAFIEAGGKAERVSVVYNGFDVEKYQASRRSSSEIRQALGIEQKFVVGHFSRLSPWKGQHILIEALAHCPDPVMALLVGDALFGEQDYVEQLHQQVHALGLGDRVKFLGFQSDVISLMAACDLVAHTSTAPEPFGRVIVEAMLCGTPVVATAAGGAIELVQPNQTGWLTPPGDVQALAAVVNQCHHSPETAQTIAHAAQEQSRQRFNLEEVSRQIHEILLRVGSR
ncbi:glycosyltransferase family 4 protein [Egbenema bharatensis]|uniref:glycosyltransferase family 4 protein n=1 Tax=Egbenema bharatensis TaxID=3463334 RepID=UPI003A88A6C5